jgi:hypothetical protein
LITKGPTTVSDEVVRIPFSWPASLVYLRYDLHGVLERSPSVPGRVLLGAAALKVRHDLSKGPTRIVIAAPKVLSAACRTGGEASLRPCGAPTEDGWVVLLKGAERQDSVMAQLNL